MGADASGESIVVGTDGSDTAKRAVGEAVRLAQALRAVVHIVSAYEPVRDARIAGAPEGAAKVWAPLPDAEVQSVLQEAASTARLAGAEVETHAVHASAADALLEVADTIGASLIVVGNKGMQSAKRFLLGSVPDKISHHAPCSVLIVRTS